VTCLRFAACRRGDVVTGTKRPAKPVDWMKPSASGVSERSLVSADHGVPSGAIVTPR
jgi:hypothetical protein